MKQIQIILIIFLTITYANAQDSPISQIKTVARYQDDVIELRFFPDRKTSLDYGLKSGFIIERADGDSNTFKEIARTIPYSKQQWSEVLQKIDDLDAKIQIEIAQDFYIESLSKNGGNVNLSEGIANLKKQKSKEDFKYMVFILTAIKNGDVAKGLGLTYIDKNMKSGVRYTYRVKLVENPPVYEIQSPVTTVKAIIVKNRYTNKVSVKTGDTNLGFVWVDHPKLTGVEVERTIDGVNTRLNNAPIYTLRGKNYKGVKRNGFSEDSLINYKKYTYRFYAQTIFGERVKFAEVTGMPRDLTPPQDPFLKQPKHAKPDEVHVMWEMKKPLAKDFKGFAISRSDRNNGYFSLIHDKLLPKNARKFIDKSFDKTKTNYYLVQALDTANNVSSSFPVSVTFIDSVPPIKPHFISGKVDSLGVVTVSIKKNKEKDLMGYRLYRSNSPTHEFSAINEGFLSLDSLHKNVKTVFRDTITLKSLTPYIYYRTEALDFHHNTSVFSDILKVKRPDNIPPTTPVFKRVVVHKKEIELYFALSKSKDVVAQYLYRKTNRNDSWEKITSFNKNQKKFIDKKLKQGVKYYYSLRAKDDSGNFSKYAIPVYGKPFDDGARPVVINLITNMDREKKMLSLNWEYPKKYTDVIYAIYKKNKKGQLIHYINVKSKMFKESLNKGIHEYGIKVFTKDGGESKISKIVSIEIP